MTTKSVQQLITDQDRKIQELLTINNDLIKNYFELNQRYQDCKKDGEEKQIEIDRLNNIINTGGIPPNIQQRIEILEQQVREWRHLAQNFSTRIHNGAEFHIFIP